MARWAEEAAGEALAGEKEEGTEGGTEDEKVVEMGVAMAAEETVEEKAAGSVAATAADLVD